MEDIDLPMEPLSDPPLPAAPPFLRPNSRKRSVRSYELQDEDSTCSAINTSSDPAMFSSDETPDAENYSDKRKKHKRKYRGTWWTAQHRPNRMSDASDVMLQGPRKKREFRRNFDSGIFMGSDDGSTELSSDSSFGLDLVETHDAFRASARKTQEQNASEMRRKFTVHISHEADLLPIFEKLPRSQLINPKQHQVRNIVRRCLEEGKEDIDLSGLALQDLPLDLVELTTMVKTANHTGSAEPHTSLEAYPRLYLGNNSIRQFPSAVLELTNLRLLSLRQNKLTSLPTGIWNLVNLETLNISGNKLQHLPWEILILVRHHSLSEINSEPNPWTTQSEDKVTKSLPTGGRLACEPAKKTSKSGAPYLSEVILRQLAKVNTSSSNLVSLMPSDTSTQVLQMLQSLHEVQVGGGSRCSSPGCDRNMIVPRWQWVEYWDVKKEVPCNEDRTPRVRAVANQPREPQILPFLRSICGQCEFSRENI